jgi:hypothetical protein
MKICELWKGSRKILDVECSLVDLVLVVTGWTDESHVQFLYDEKSLRNLTGLMRVTHAFVEKRPYIIRSGRLPAGEDIVYASK